MSTSKTSLEESHLPEASGKVWSKEHLPAVEKNQVREHLKKLDVHKFMGLGSMHLWLLRELANDSRATLLSLDSHGN